MARRLIPLAIVGLCLAFVTTLIQVQVSADVGTVERTCGSVFDSVVDRSGWRVWWAQDLEDPDPAVRAELLRTTRCPDALNTRLAMGAVLGAVSGVVLGWSRRGGGGPVRTSPASTDLSRVGRMTSAVGGVLTAGGVIGILLLVADANSTLFLYVDRPVVALLGLIVLLPAVALFLGGRVLSAVGLQSQNTVEEDESTGDGN